MIINYKLSKQDYKITFCRDKESPDITVSLSKLYSDKKMLLIIDKKLNKNFTKYLFKDLRQLGFDLTLMRVNGSKINKNKKFLFKIIDKLIEKKFTKKSTILSCGGGVIGDVSALASSLYLRGLIYLHIPTTMTAIVDSCIGGKTGINYNQIINSVGNYYHPKNVFISKNVINLIPSREFLAGVPEIIKSGMLNSNLILKILRNNKDDILNRNFKIISKIIFNTLKIKIRFFKNDVYENSKRLSLNFGHTFAHSIEMALQGKKQDVIRHGEAVGIGMLCEIFYTEGKSRNFEIVKNLLKLYGLPINLLSFKKTKNTRMLKKEIFQNIFLDKKRINKYPRCINVKKIKKPTIIEMKNNSKIKETIKKVLF
tara:strand:+ start:334 stop:1440 length:1107 start_codon:yes stop_codon:yes gene_type:complete